MQYNRLDVEHLLDISVLQVLGDEGRRKEYDTLGQAGFGAGGMGGGAAGGFQGQWQQSSMDPEELFRKIFGNQAFDRGGMFDESMFGGFNTAHEVSKLITIGCIGLNM